MFRFILASILGLALVGCGGDSVTGGDGGSSTSPATHTDGGSSNSDTPTADGGGGGDPDRPLGGPVGSPCTRDEQCTEPPSAKCYTTVGGPPAPVTITFPGGYCSLPCGDNASGGNNEPDDYGDTGGEEVDCGEGASCATVTLSEFSNGSGSTMRVEMCAPKCEGPQDCRVAEGYRCFILIPGFPGFCTL